MSLSAKLKIAGVIALVISYFVFVDLTQRKNARRYELLLNDSKSLTNTR